MVTIVFPTLFTKTFLCDTLFSSVLQTGGFTKVVSSSEQCETKLGNVVIQAVTGDITKETSDIIVNSSNDKFTLKSGKPGAPTIRLFAKATLYRQVHKNSNNKFYSVQECLKPFWRQLARLSKMNAQPLVKIYLHQFLAS